LSADLERGGEKEEKREGEKEEEREGEKEDKLGRGGDVNDVRF